MTIAAAIAALTDIGVFPVIAVGAVLFLAGNLYKKFRR